MTDLEAIDFLVAKLGSAVVLAASLQVTPSAVTNWRFRGISSDKRPEVWMMVNDHGGNLPREWLKKPANPNEKAA